ncbi:MAG: 6-phosphogluconolactonase [Chloroflexi bacterium]|jgi:6-phosphogluconolactonase|nr:MAG: 6-phosphogluconolactonase [Chloroflexota bacterium]
MTPNLPNTHICISQSDPGYLAGDLLLDLSEKAVTSKGCFTIALSGGSSPQGLYTLLASEKFKGHISWNKWLVFWGDERTSDTELITSNYKVANQTLLSRVPIPKEQIYRIASEINPDKTAKDYYQNIYAAFGFKDPVFDLILLGMGKDGHTASLFPGTEALNEKNSGVVASWVPSLKTTRITFTLPLINNAKNVAFLVKGISKAMMVKKVLQPAETDPVPPASLVRPINGELYWFIDRLASTNLT